MFDSGTKLSRAFLSATRPVGEQERRQQHEAAAGPNSEAASLRRSEPRALRMQEFDQDLNAQMPPERPPKQDARHHFGELCYSAANVALILACVLAIVQLIRFVLDNTLHEYIEYIISLAFYRQLIFVLVAVPLVLLVPVYNAMSVCLDWDSKQGGGGGGNKTNEHNNVQRSVVQDSSLAAEPAQSTSTNRQSALVIKLTCEVILIILLFIALIFVGPYVRSSTLISHIDMELKRHMRNRYENSFSMPFLDELQQEYRCCDQTWYQDNLQIWIPVSCFPRIASSESYDRSCADVIGTLVSERCAIISACLVIALISLAALVVLDILRLLTLKMVSTRRGGKSYEFIGSNARRANQTDGAILSRPIVEPTSEQRFRRRFEDERKEMDGDVEGEEEEEDEDEKQHNELSEELLKPSEIVNRLKLNERDRQELVSSSPIDFDKIDQLTEPRAKERSIESPRQVPPGQPLEDHRGSPTILTRARYVTVRRERSQSPTFVDSIERAHIGGTSSDSPSSIGSDHRETKPLRGVLKKTSSYQKLESEHTERREHLETTTSRWDSDEDDDNDGDYARRLRENATAIMRHQQTRRSLLNVRFADN